MMYYELSKIEDGKRLFAAGDFTTDELIVAELDGWVMLEDKPKRKQRKKPAKRRKSLNERHNEVDWGMFERAKQA